MVWLPDWQWEQQQAERRAKAKGGASPQASSSGLTLPPQSKSTGPVVVPKIKTATPVIPKIVAATPPKALHHRLVNASSSLVVPKVVAATPPKALTSAVVMQQLQQKTVTLFNFSDELKTLEQAELTEQVKVELEAFGEISAIRYSPGALDTYPRDRRLFAYYKNADSAGDAVKGLSDTTFDIPFQITLGVVMGAGSGSKVQTNVLTKAFTKVGRSCKVTIYVDELPMPKRPAVEPSLTDSEVWIDPLPDEEDLEEWCKAFGAVSNIFRIPQPPSLTGGKSHKGYVKFKEHGSARACVEAGAGSWSESERALSWQRGEKGPARDHTYPYSVVSALIGDKGAGINSLRQECGVWGMKIEGLDNASKTRRLCLEAEGDEVNILKVRPELEKRLSEIHEEIGQFLSQRGDDVSQGRAGHFMKDGLVLPKWSWIIHIDELKMPARPEVEPVSTDREVWVLTTPTDEEFDAWKDSFGTISDVFRVPSVESDNEKGYVLFKEHAAAKACVEAGVGVWSESERALAWQGQKSKVPRTYPTSVVSWFLRNNGDHLRDVAKKCGILRLNLSGETLGESNVSKRLHFVVEGGRQVTLDPIKQGLEEKLTKLHKEMLYYKHDSKDEKHDNKDERRDSDEQKQSEERGDWDRGRDDKPPRKRRRPHRSDRQRARNEEDHVPSWDAPTYDEPPRPSYGAYRDPEAWNQAPRTPPSQQSGQSAKRPRPTRANYTY